MKKIIEQILRMPYYQNYAARSGKVHNVANHEGAVEDILIQHSLVKVERKIKKVQRDAWLNGTSDDVTEGTYISQPCGTHDSPDFIVKTGGRLYFIECKSVTKEGTPLYNSGLPKKDYIYVFSSKKYDETTVYLGRDVAGDTIAMLLEQANQEIKARCNEVTQQLRAMGENTHGLGIYARPMYQHYGSNEKKDYFKNSRREELEQNVLDFV
tara:strand:- start:1779 stop:2411 length:633 start_codon:yes stop_codon:yes gene_type:complete